MAYRRPSSTLAVPSMKYIMDIRVHRTVLEEISTCISKMQNLNPRNASYTPAKTKLEIKIKNPFLPVVLFYTHIHFCSSAVMGSSCNIDHQFNESQQYGL